MPLDLNFLAGTYFIEDDGIRGNNRSQIRGADGTIYGTFEHPTDTLRFFADHREGVLAQGAEFLRAKAAGLVGDDHVLGEIGEVMAGTLPGRRDPGDVTIYKSLGSIVQDLAAARHIVVRLKDRSAA